MHISVIAWSTLSMIGEMPCVLTTGGTADEMWRCIPGCMSGVGTEGCTTDDGVGGA
ncbi:hypothetical protein TRAPUB_3585 [Trametes pubescens]|uniref:Uncharacterized protein n=1 Tax=Trametes pubescens TaxID=154538 RepID=A0A1M2VDD9_TRAPU|nr:hypothetical protein TRAPUB_7643 [Trametes pubescens]OJT05595.1 hypothetical protein TRAPUB_3585 [Trametes pubescens]